MTQYIICSPRLYMIDGIPASEAGEWPGIKSNKFNKTKKIIHIKNSNIFSFDDNFQKYNKKIIKPKQKEKLPPEQKARRISSALTLKKLKSKAFHNDLFPTSIQHYNRLIINREYDFEKKAKYYKMIQDSHNKRMKEFGIMNKTKNNSNLGKIISGNNTLKGFNKEFYEKVSSNKILGISLNHDIYQKYKNNIEKMKKFNNDIKNVMKKRKVNNYKYLNRKKVLKIMEEEKKLKFDLDYVACLDYFESKII